MSIQFNCYVVSDYRRRRSVSSSFPCHRLFEAKFQRSSHWSAASSYPCMLFFTSPCLLYVKFFLSITDIPNLSFRTNALKTQVAFSNCFHQCSFTFCSDQYILIANFMRPGYLQDSSSNHISASFSLFCSSFVIV